MLSLPQRRTLGYGVAIFGVGLALVITTNVDLLAGRTPLFFAAVMIATWFGGRNAGIVAVTISALTSFYFIVPPQYSFNKDPSGFVQTGTFILVCLPISLLIAALRAREGSLRSSEERYRLLFDNNPFPMWVFDLETLAFLAVNDSATFHYGYSRKEFLAMTIKDIRPGDELPGLMRYVANERPRLSAAGVWKHRKKDGTIVEVEVTSHELMFEGRAARLVLATDVTERRRAEIAVHESEERLQTIIENLTEGLAVSDLDGNLLHFNRAAINSHGFTDLEECQLHMSKFAEILELSDMDGRVLSLDEWPLARILRGEAVRNFELRFKRKDREWTRFFDYGGVLIRDFEDKPMMAIVTISDITERKLADIERKQAEGQIRRLNETLENRVIERTAELQAVNKELEAFSYSVSHDLRAPLRHINGFSQALLEDCADKLDETGKSYLNEVKNASQEMAGLIDDILQLARVTRTEMHRQQVDLSGLVSEIVRDIRKRDPGRNVNVTVGDNLLAYGDKRLLGVALTNLIENAWKFTSKEESAEIIFGREQNNGHAGFFVRDNGAGFDMAYADKLYGAFQRLHSVNEFDGTGIGLATVLRVINRHGGRVWAEGKVNKGATFYFELPDHKESENEG